MFHAKDSYHWQPVWRLAAGCLLLMFEYHFQKAQWSHFVQIIAPKMIMLG